MDLATLYKTQISLSEWFAHTDYPNIESFRLEDNEKRERLKILEEIIGLPFDKPTQFTARDLADRSPKLEKFLHEHGHELCALRLIPLEPDLPKLRMRGHTVVKSMDWFFEQLIDPDKYKADFVPHTENLRKSTIFVINDQGIFGEFIDGMHAQLTQGFYVDQKPIQFSYDFNTNVWWLSEENEEIFAYLKDITGRLRVLDLNKRVHLQKKLQSQFVNGFLKGYFETGYSEDFGLWYFDYNRLLGAGYQNFIVTRSHELETTGQYITGMTASPGKVRGRVRVVDREKLTEVDFADGEILVCDMTTPDYLPLMKKAAAIVTDRGGILTHAAIIARELSKPCIVATHNATQKLQDNDMIEVDADSGIIKLIL